MREKNILAVIIARKGSKGVPGKNLKLLAGKPLIYYMISTAKEAAIIRNMDIVLSTDSEKIREFGIKAGISAPFLRPQELAEDNVPSWPVVKHAVIQMELTKNIKYDIIVYLQPTCPLCKSGTILECISSIEDSAEFVSAVAVTGVSTHPFRMKRLMSNGYLINLIDQGFEDMRPRQVLPAVYQRAGSVYASLRKVVMEDGTLVGEPCKGVIVPKDEAIDIDTELDFLVAEQAMLERESRP